MEGILTANRNIVYRLKSIGALEIEFAAPIPEQITTTTMHFSKVSGGAILKVFITKVGRSWPLFEILQCVSRFERGIENLKNGQLRPTLAIQTFSMALLTQGK